MVSINFHKVPMAILFEFKETAQVPRKKKLTWKPQQKTKVSVGPQSV